MAIQQYSVREIVDRAVSNGFGMPEFQRGFVWTPAKVQEMVVSLFQDYPIGAMLLWRPPSDDASAPGRTADASPPEVWVVDGQQRTTAMCLLFGRKPYWWRGDDSDWNDAISRYDIHINPLLDEGQFETPKRSVRQDGNYISVRDILNADDSRIGEHVKRIHANNPESSEIAVLMALNQVRDIGRRQVVAFLEAKDLEDTVEIFQRLNQSGTRVNEGDVFRAQVAARNPHWVNRTFQPFLDDLESDGFNLEPTLIFRSLIAANTGQTRFKDTPRGFWNNESLSGHWDGVAQAWRTVIRGLWEHGILSDDLLPSKNALIPLVTMAHRFGENFRVAPALAWLIHATCTNRYSRTTDTRLAEDIRIIRDSNDFADAVGSAIANLRAPDFAAEDNRFFKGNYRDSGVQLILYLLAYANEAHDWSSSKDRIGFAGAEFLRGFNPDWHHIFPRAYLRGTGAFKNVDAPANIVAIRKETNLRIGRKAPMEYMEGISDKLLREQYVPTDRSLFTIDRYDEFIERRAADLAAAANELMAGLESGLAVRQREVG